jgi:hypothetical protein
MLAEPAQQQVESGAPRNEHRHQQDAERQHGRAVVIERKENEEDRCQRAGIARGSKMLDPEQAARGEQGADDQQQAHLQRAPYRKSGK